MILHPDPADSSTKHRGSPQHAFRLVIPFRRLVPPFCLALVALAIWCGVTERWSLSAWATPLQLHGDPLEIYTRVQAAAEDLSQPLRGFAELPRIAAPFGADWSRYPISDRVIFTLLGLLARGVGVFAAVNLAVAFVHMLNAVAFYLAGRFLRWRAEWAFAAGLLYSFSSYNFRWGVTVSFSLTFVIPPLLLLCGWIARPAPAVRARAWTWLAAALGLWFGGANPYFGFFVVQLVGGAVLLQWARRRELARWRAGVVLIAVAGVSFLLHNAAYFLASTAGNARLTLARNYAGAEIYALKLSDLLVPPAEHVLRLFGDIGRGYYAQSALRTEFFINYLGVLGIFGLALLIWAGVRGMLRRSGARIPDAFFGLLWTLIFAAVGGVNSLLALGGLEIFRASNRYSVFILAWALFFLGSWCQRRWRPRMLWLRWALPALLVTVGVFDSLPRLHARRLLRQNAAEIASMQRLMDNLETRLGAGAMIYQLPAAVFPEAGTVVRMPDYEHFLAYLLSDSIRGSYGALRGTDVSRCLRALSRLPAPKLKEELEAAGFAALWVDRRGLPEDGKALLAQLRALRLEEFPATPAHLAIFLLKPAAQPRPLDLANPTLYEAWDTITTLSQPEVVVLDGWYDLEKDGARTWRWAQREATGSLRMPSAGKVELSFRSYSLNPGQLVVTCRGREVLRQPVTPGTRDLRTIVLNLPAGRHPLVWRFTGRATHPMAPDGRRLGFAVEDLTVTPESPRIGQP